MAIYNKGGSVLTDAYSVNGNELNNVYDINGDLVFDKGGVDYTNYSFTQKWVSKGITPAQGFDIYDDKVFWVQKSGDATIPSNCYVWNLSDGTQALSSQYVTIYSGHGNNVAFAYPNVYCSPAYPPSRAYVNTVSADFMTFTLDKTLVFDDGSTDCDVCLDETDNTIVWTLGHTNDHTDLSAPFYISKWDLDDLTDNGDDTYTPNMLNTVSTPQPSSSYYFQGCRMHDGLLWYTSGDGTQRAYVFAANPNTGAVEYTIDLETNTEPEGLAWIGNTLYVGFQGMMLREYTFAQL